MRTAIAFLLLGISNNVTFCIVLAIAKDIENGGVGVVFLALQLPALLIKTTGPTWMHLLGYRTRTIVQATAASSGLMLIALSTFVEDDMKRLAIQLLGVSLCSVQNAVGEPSYLALSSVCLRPASALAAWSTGTGLAGLLGFAWVMLLKMLSLSLLRVCLLSLVFPAQLLVSFFFILPSQTHGYASAEIEESQTRDETAAEVSETTPDEKDECEDESATNILISSPRDNPEESLLVSSEDLAPTKFHPLQRFKFAMSLWRFMIPLFLVYLAEYNMQSGAWSAIGFPLDDESARNQFYRTSNIMYQCGVFVSRSCGQFFTINLYVLWVVPLLQAHELAGLPHPAF
uniref:Battenin n=1 Tax=Guillardia theta TaxID=55529 RepID=A0A7S4L226_GUITH|mmetsp:Transcript_35557/g.111240  ORF Transcript_35557/g.111240 Transcript_35557/m.111240 type:complete len:344 (+) Transcript_35557:186-1217(+)